jgi:hypothetical protein
MIKIIEFRLNRQAVKQPELKTNYSLLITVHGGVPERLKGPVLKTGVANTHPGFESQPHRTSTRASTEPFGGELRTVEPLSRMSSVLLYCIPTKASSEPGLA